MNIQILAERNARALARIEKVAPRFSAKFGVPAELSAGLVAPCKDKAVEGMLRVEAVASLLEFLAGEETGAEGGQDRARHAVPLLVAQEPDLPQQMEDGKGRHIGLPQQTGLPQQETVQEPVPAKKPQQKDGSGTRPNKKK